MGIDIGLGFLPERDDRQVLEARASPVSVSRINDRIAGRASARLKMRREQSPMS